MLLLNCKNSPFGLSSKSESGFNRSSLSLMIFFSGAEFWLSNDDEEEKEEEDDDDDDSEADL